MYDKNAYFNRSGAILALTQSVVCLKELVRVTFAFKACTSFQVGIHYLRFILFRACESR